MTCLPCPNCPRSPEAEEEFGTRTPWDSVTKLEWVHKKAGTSATTRRKIVWQLSAINDLVRSKSVTSGELSINGLSGSKRGGRGMLDLMLFKLDLLDEFIINQADKCGLSAGVKCTLRKVFDSHATFRMYLGDTSDMTWMSTMPLSAKEFISTIGVSWPIHPHVPSHLASLIIPCLPLTP